MKHVPFRNIWPSDTFTLLDNQLVNVLPSLDSNDGLAMTLGPWVKAARQFVHMLHTSLNAGSPQNITQIAGTWEQHFINIQTQPNLQDSFSNICLPYDVMLHKTYMSWSKFQPCCYTMQYIGYG